MVRVTATLSHVKHRFVRSPRCYNLRVPHCCTSDSTRETQMVVVWFKLQQSL